MMVLNKLMNLNQNLGPLGLPRNIEVSFTTSALDPPVHDLELVPPHSGEFI